MIDFIEYVVAELRGKRLSKENALSLIRQFSVNTANGKTSALHPLLHRNTSSIDQQCYASSFTGEEFFLSDHRIVTGETTSKVLPGVAYLEMAQAAMKDAVPHVSNTEQVQLRDVVWLQPIVVNELQEVFIRLLPGDASEQPDDLDLEFEVFTADAEEMIHCRGRAVLTTHTAPERLDIDAIKARVSGTALDGKVIYPAYRKMGMQFGPAHQPVARLFPGDGEVLAELALPAAVSGTLQEYQLHPSLVDGALQASIGLSRDLSQLPDRPAVPFALESIETFAGCKSVMYSWMRYSRGSPRQEGVSRLDIDLCDEQGNVCVRLRGFSSRNLSARVDSRQSSSEIGLVLANPVWKTAKIQRLNDNREARHQILLCNLPGISSRRLQQLLPEALCQEVCTSADGIAERFAATALDCFKTVRALMQNKARALVQIVVPEEAGSKLFAGLSGLLKSAALENPEITGQLLLIPADVTAEGLESHLRAEAQQTTDVIVRYEGAVRQVLSWEEQISNSGQAPAAFKEDGVYLITGGLGALGKLFAKEIIQQTRRAKVIFTGRAPSSASVEEQLIELADDSRVEYRSLDVTDAAQVRQLLSDVVAAHGQLNGILHSAGMTADNFIANKTPEEFAQVLAPKVFGAVNLDQASADLDLDFLALFSSGAALMGNVGQADYAVANAFLDQFADYRNRLRASGQRKGLTFSINWPLWQEGGMQMGGRDQEAMREFTGMHAMQTRSGMSAFHRILNSHQPQTAVIEGELAKIRRAMFNEPAELEAPELVAQPVPVAREFASQPAGSREEQTREYLRQQFSGLFKLPAARIDPRAPLEKYGIDSILAMDLTRQLEKTFGPLSKTLFFEHQTIDELTGYFAQAHAAVLDALFKVSEKAAEPRSLVPAPTPSTETPRASRRNVRGRVSRERPVSPASKSLSHDEPIAIVGLSGRYPESPDIEAFWNNLRDGKDCITEVPGDRWDWREYYSEDRTAEDRHYSKWGGFIAGVDEFDPLFFNIAPSEAASIDPQERLFLQHAWRAIEDAGYTRASLQTPHESGLAGQVGVYVGVMYGEYQLFGAESSLLGKRIGVPVSYASIANRVSYVLNLHGPSMTLDTMCSSSLSAIHLACQDLRQGRTSLAIAGGVNVTIHPNKYLILSAGQFISSDGHCQSFGEGGDGYIPGEGVGVVLLKKLSDAQRDGNHIYGLIRGSALNHGGKTNGYSVPNPKAQAAVIAQALQDGHVDPRHISYIEAHGTGTKLGDPIEIAALTQVFRRHTQDNQFCALGSAKSNIGHCESAAGIAGLTKVLLQMKHGLIAPSLHSSRLNPHIDFETTPFVVNQALRPWDSDKIPRLAGISSFGAGGSNAHLIIEEYRSSIETPQVDGAGPQVIVLSARTLEQLQQKTRDLLTFLEQRDRVVDLPAMAYTLQVGREAMDVRAAFVVDSIAQLAEKLTSYVHGEIDIEQVFSGRVDRNAEGMSVLGHDEEMLEAIDKWIARGKLTKLADLWAKGLDLDWRKLHSTRQPRLISLPAYPFARERYWIERPTGVVSASESHAATLHPLLHANTADFFQQSYASVFNGEEFFLADHQIELGAGGKQKVLPAVAYLEMVRAALEFAWPTSESRVFELRNAAWAQPLVADQSKRVSIALLPAEEGSVEFEIASRDESAAESILHCQGQAAVCDEPAPAALDLVSLKAQMTQEHVTAEDIYAAFKTMGIHYGRSFQCITALRRGHEQLIAELSLPSSLEQKLSDYLLHPSLVDAALQASIGLLGNLSDLPTRPSIPFALGSLRVAAPCTSRMVAWVRYSEGGRPENGVTKIDIDLCGSDGRVCAQMRGLALRAMKADEMGSLLVHPVWEPITRTNEVASAYQRHEVVLCNLSSLDIKQLEGSRPGMAVRHLPLAQSDSIAERYRVAAVASFEHLQKLLQERSQQKVLFQLVIGSEGDDTLLAGLSGLIRTARQEGGNLVGQVIITDRAVDERTLAEQLHSAAEHPTESLFKYERNAASVLRWKPVQGDSAADFVAFKDGGVYLITGGLGGLGVLFASAILKSAPTATVILTGRSALTDEKSRSLEQLRTELAVDTERLVYGQLDLDSAEAVASFVEDITKRFGGLNGVIHSAGMIQDRLIVNKTSDEFAQVLSPKVFGAANLDSATRTLELDFFVLFSSVAAAMGNVGQADYAAANGFMDQFASYRNRLLDAGERRGRTVSINWPLWEQGGMQIDPRAREALLRDFGIVPMKTASGVRAFHDSLRLQVGQTLVLEGHLDRLRRLFVPDEPVAKLVTPPAEVASDSADAAALVQTTQRWLTTQLSDLLKIPAHEVDPKAQLERYGIDSILAMKLTQRLEESFGSLSKTLFFEYQTLASLAGYLAKAFPRIVQEKTGRRSPDQAAATPVVELRAIAPKALTPLKTRFARPSTQTDIDVAIVGLGGRYPLADNLEEFWENLKSGRDCITEVPQDRWDNARIFDPGRNQAGKTYSKWGGFMRGVDRFDPLFFNISPREAQLIDPQERLFLETVWETIEDAGYSKDSIAQNRVGVFVGAMWGQYELFGVNAPESGIPSSSFASIANRISYFFNFHGPSMAVDTMCSSSLTAIHLACEEIRKGNVDVAVAGGVNVSVHPAKYLGLSQGNFVASDGRCRSFGAGGDGYVPGEGVGAVLLKPLHRALADGDQIYAVIKASTINHGGKTNGYTVPNPIAQSELIAEAIGKARIDPATIGYVETHGTGTSLGDPIEIAGLTKAFTSASTPSGQQICAIGSVKSNIGHLESAAGIAAVTKSLLQLKHQQLVPSLHAEPLNPNIDFAQTPFYVQTRLEDWQQAADHPRRVAISSFGAGGSNAHLILEEVIDTRRASATEGAPRVEAFVLSAKSCDSLQAYGRRMLDFLERASDLSLVDLAFTSQVGRTPMQDRLVVLASNLTTVREKLAQWLRAPSEPLDDVYEGSTRDSKSSASDPNSLIEGDAGQAFVRMLLEKNDLSKLAKLWISGVEVDWTLLSRVGRRPRRVSLPTYPFSRERYWIAPASTAAQPLEVPAVPQDEKRLMHYEPEWRAGELAGGSSRSDERLPVGPLLILDATDELFREFGRRNQTTDGTQIVLVKYGARYEQLTPDIFTVDPENEADSLRLMETLKSSQQLPRAIVHRCDSAADGEIQQQLARGIYALHHLCKAMMKQKPMQAVRVISIRPSPDALHSALGGFFRTLTLENPQFSGKVVTLDDSAASIARVAQVLIAELRDENGQNSEVRYLDGRQVKQLRCYVPTVAGAHTAIKQKGLYLVTGGLGGLGYLFSEHLVRNYGCKLALLGRSALNAEQQRKLAHLKSHNAEVHYFQADVCNRGQLAAVVRELKERFGGINGVIHSAGIHRDSFILNKSREEMQAVLAAKVTGTLNLDLVTRDEPLDLFVMFSSVAAALGNPGQSDYAFANSFMDAFAEHRETLCESRQRFGRTLSIDWPFWEEGGMRLSRSDLELTEQRSGVSPLPTQEGIRFLEDRLRSEGSQAVVLYGIPSKIDAAVLPTNATATPTHRPTIEVADAGTLLEQTEQYLTALLSREIKLSADRIDTRETFASFGVDSMMINRINASLAQDLGELPQTLLYQYESVAELAKYLTEQAQPALARYFEVPAPAASGAAVAPVLDNETVTVDDSPRSEASAPASTEAIAIIGMHCHFPHSKTPAQYWANLWQGKDLIDPVPASRWDAAALDRDIYCKWGGFLDDVDKFDAAFFSIAKEDARLMDPQERLFLQSTWAAIEDAGYTRDSLKKHFPKANSADVGVFAGVTTNSYQLLGPDEWSRGNHVTPGAMPWSLANRVSYFFDFKGPSIPIDTACSSSLVAMHQACESLRRGECQVAIAGGVNLYLHPAKYQSLCSRRMLATGNQCRSFGAGDDGFIPGEGVGTLVLKPLSRAIEHGDHIYGVIAASSVEHSGRSNGYGAPNPTSQGNLIEQTLRKGSIHPESLGYVEGHGTGTQLGDSLEVASLTAAFRRFTQKKQFCSIGSVKANIGHAESAAGIAGVAKILMQFRHGQLAPTIHSTEVNPDITFDSSPFYLQHDPATWESSGGHPRRAMINSFGAGGVNSCVILEEHRPEAIESIQGANLIVLSARSEARLRESASQLSEFLHQEPATDLTRLAYTLQTGREAMQERLAIVTSSRDELLKALDTFNEGKASSNTLHGRVESRRKKQPLKQSESAEWHELAQLWISGAEVDWDNVHQTRPRKLSLPTYPFAKERYWVSDTATPVRAGRSGPQEARLHPLVAHNVSTLQDVCFSSLLDADQYYARDHKVNGEAFFPGAGFLEIACVNGAVASERKVVAIRDIVWNQPLRLAAGTQLVKSFLKANGNDTEYVIVSFDADNERVVHSEGRLVHAAEDERRNPHKEKGQPPVTIQSLKTRCSKTLRGAQCYETFERFGLQYGASFQTIQELYVGGDFALAKLRLHESLEQDFEQYLLHPSLIDGALQAVVGLAADGSTEAPYLPFALDAVEILQPLPPTCYAYVEPAESENSQRQGIKRFNIRLLSESGEELVRLNNFYVRAFRDPQAAQEQRVAPVAGTDSKSVPI